MRPKQRNFRLFVSIIIILLTLGLLFYYVYNHFNELVNVFHLNYLFLFSLIALVIVSSLLAGIHLDIVTEDFGIKLSFYESFKLSMVANFYNTITPLRGGMAARAIYLKQKHKLGYIDFLATMSSMYIITFTVSSLAGIISMLVIRQYTNDFNFLIFGLFLIFFLPLTGIIIVSPRLKERKSKFINNFVHLINSWHDIRKNKKIIFATLGIAMLQLIVGIITTIFLYNLFGVSIGFFKAMFITALGSLSILLAITPGNLGIGDAVNIFSANLLGIGLPQAIGATILGRAINLLVVLILGPIFSYSLWKDKKKKKIMRKKR